MSSIQQFLVIGGLLLLSNLILTYHRSESTQSTAMIDNEAIITGSGIAQSTIDEILCKAFDENTIDKAAESVNDLTSSASLGLDYGESNPLDFDDVDDYDGYVKKDTLSRLGVFTTRIDVYYVQENNPEVKSNNRTFLKRVDVVVTNPIFKDTIKTNYLVSY